MEVPIWILPVGIFLKFNIGFSLQWPIVYPFPSVIFHRRNNSSWRQAQITVQTNSDWQPSWSGSVFQELFLKLFKWIKLPSRLSKLPTWVHHHTITEKLIENYSSCVRHLYKLLWFLLQFLILLQSKSSCWSSITFFLSFFFTFFSHLMESLHMDHYKGLYIFAFRLSRPHITIYTYLTEK